MRRETSGGWCVWLARLLLPAAALCQLGGDCGTVTSAGALGNASFSFRAQSGDDIPVTPIASGGTTVEIRAWVHSGGCNPAPSFTHVASSHPDVATFTYDGALVTATTGAPGTTDLELLAADDKLVDRLSLEVEDIAALRFANAAAPRVLSGSGFQVGVGLFDAEGRPLSGPGRVQVTGTAPLSVTASDHFLGTAAVVSGTGAGPGTGTITAVAGDVQASLDVQVVARTDITAVELGTGSWAPRYFPSGRLWAVWTTPSTAEGPVYGAACSWTISDPSVTLSSSSTAADMDDSVHNNAQFELASPGTFSATCTVGGAQTTVTLKR